MRLYLANPGVPRWCEELAGFGEVTEVRQDDGKVSYLREDGLTEWFINDTRGLEQGWTFTKRPERAGSSGPVRLDLTVRGGLRPQVAAEGASVAFLNESGGAALTYGGLKAWDADGKTVQVRFVASEAGDKGLGVVVNDAGARYPITGDLRRHGSTASAAQGQRRRASLSIMIRRGTTPPNAGLFRGTAAARVRASR